MEIIKLGSITATALNIRKGPSTSYEVITVGYKDEIVEIVETSNNWHKIKLQSGKVGWGSGKYIDTLNTERGKITASVLNIRKGPSTSYEIVTKGYKNEIVEIIETSNNWHKVRLESGKIGWASGKYIEIQSTEIGIITVSALNIRKGPSTSYEIITIGYKGDEVEIIETSNKWHKVRFKSGLIGWASGKYIEIKDNNKENTPTDSEKNEDTDNNDKVDNIIKLAKQQLGKPYEWAAEGPDSFDCSGLVYYVYMRNGIDLPRVSRQQYTVGEYVEYKDIKPGDLVFSSTNKTGNVSHVGIYLGDGNMIHSPSSGSVVKIVSIDTSYWKSVYIGAKRVV